MPEAESPRGSLLRHLDLSGTDQPRIIAQFSEDEWKAEVATWEFKGARASPSLRSRGGLLGLACRLACGRAQTTEQKERMKTAELEAARVAAAQAESAASSAAPLSQVQLPPPPAVPKTSSEIIKLSTVVDQGNAGEIVLLDEAKFVEGLSNYHKRFDGPPGDEEEPTDEQYTAVVHLFKVGRSPYVDFAVFGPHGDRTARKLRFHGMVPNGEGGVRMKEIYGPSTFTSWLSSWRVFATTCIMSEQISPMVLQRYARQIERYASHYGHEIWAIIYQADVRARRERLVKIHRAALVEKEQVELAGGTHPMDINKPWSHCLDMLIRDRDFWKWELEDPAMAIITKAGKMSTFVGTDAIIAGGGAPQRLAPGHGGAGGNIAGAPSLGAKHPGGSDPKPAPKRQRVQHGALARDAEGNYLTNRALVDLCGIWNKGTCSGTLDMQGRCSVTGAAHQCNRCLEPTHPGHKCEKQPKLPYTKGGGKGKGKGKGGGKYQ